MTESLGSFLRGVWDARHLSFQPRKIAVVLSILDPRTGRTVMVTVPDPLSPAAFHKGSRSEPFVRAARPRAPHPPAYVQHPVHHRQRHRPTIMCRTWRGISSRHLGCTAHGAVRNPLPESPPVAGGVAAGHAA